MATDVMTEIINTFLTGSKTIGFATGFRDIIPSYIFKILLFPTVLHNATFLIISVYDRVIAITYLLLFLHG